VPYKLVGCPARETLAMVPRASQLISRAAYGAHDGILAAVAAVVAYVPLQLLEFKQGFWSAIAAVAVVQSEFHTTQSTARDQFLGAAVGGLTGLCALRLPCEHTVIYSAALLASRIVCWLLNVASAGRLAAVTVTIMLLVPRPAGSAWGAVIARVSTVGWGVFVAVVTVWVAARLASPGGLAVSHDAPEDH
jgi:uncharacterized membrane protein YgaE (UPF0421/DUF939 family)